VTEFAVASEQLTKRFGRQVAVNAVDLAVPRVKERKGRMKKMDRF